MVIVVTGPSGSGKTTVGRRLAEELGWPFHEGDDYHHHANRRKMGRGEGLTDADRQPWLESLHELIVKAVEEEGDAVLACSALKHAYRDALRRDLGEDLVRFVYLQATPELLHQRLGARTGHYAGTSLLPSQLRDLEEPDDALALDASKPVAELVDDVRKAWAL